jgi:hypothetical protein
LGTQTTKATGEKNKIPEKKKKKMCSSFSVCVCVYVQETTEGATTQASLYTQKAESEHRDGKEALPLCSYRPEKKKKVRKERKLVVDKLEQIKGELLSLSELVLFFFFFSPAEREKK